MSLDGYKLQEVPGNDRCVDCQDCDCDRCGGHSDPVWASEELGIVVCEECMAIHKSLTNSTFKSVLCQDWTEESLNKLLATNNNESKEKYEKNLPVAYRKPTRCFDRVFREQWIISKYVRHDFATESYDLPKYIMGEKKGYMWKRGRDDRIFQRRWFVLDGSGALKYYLDSHATANSKRGEIPLTDLVVSPASEDKMGHTNALQLMYPEMYKNEMSIRLIYIYVEAPKDMVEWYQAIRCLKYKLLKQKNQSDHMIHQNLRSEVVREGFLMKTGSTGKGAFRKRWFILDDEKLMYLRKQLDSNPISSIKLGSHKQGYSLVQSKGDNGWHFYLKTPGRTYHLIAELPCEREAWIKAIHRVCLRIGNLESNCANRQEQSPPAAAAPRGYSLSAVAGNILPVGSLVSPGAQSSATLPAKSSAPEVEPLERSPTVPPRPFLNAKNSIEMHREKLNVDDSHQRMHDAKYHGSHQPHHPKIIVEQPIEEGEEDNKDQEVTDINSGDYVSHEELNAYMGSKMGDGRGSPVSCNPEEETAYPHSADELDLDEDDDDPYMEFVEEKVVCVNTFTKTGGYDKKLSLHIRVAPDSLSGNDKSTLSLSTVWSALPSLPGDEGCVMLCPVVSCTSFPRELNLLKPFSLEIQHCGVIKDVRTCQPKLWCMRSIPGQMMSWVEIDKSDSKISYQIKERCVIIQTKDVSVFAVKVPRDDLEGKNIRCVTYTSSDTEGHLNVRVYFINDNGADDALQEIKRREQMYGSMLCDVSHEFFLANSEDGILMSVENLNGLKDFAHSSNIISISAEDLWEKNFACHNLDLIKTAPEGYCTLKIWQENNPQEELPMELTLRTDVSDGTYQSIAPLSPGISEFVSPALPAHEIGQPRGPLTRVASDPGKDSSDKYGISREDPHHHSTPTKRLDSVEDDESGLPYQLKRHLFLLLDSNDQQGNDWRMLASKLGLDGMIYHIGEKVNPTLEVLRYFETMGQPISKLEQHLRDMERNDAADVVSKFIEMQSSKE